MRLAFYAPLKSPDHPTPSGERTVARNLMLALEGLGATLTLASTLRSRDGAGDAAVQRDVIAQADSILPDVVARGRAEHWQAWVTYHNYYKAPDLLGPAAAQALNIPYLQIESTRARKRLSGPWAGFAARAEAASDAADAILYFTEHDRVALARDAPTGQRLIHLRPFLPVETAPPASDCTGPMLSVGMLRAGDKAASYRIIADTLGLLPRDGWRLQIAGDGPAHAQIEAMMAPFGDAVQFLGALTAPQVAQTYATSGLMFWPGAGEAFGMVYLEAQAAGLPVVAQDRPGVRDVLAPGTYPAPDAGPEALAKVLAAYLSNPARRRTDGAAARRHIAENHLLPAARATLKRALFDCGVVL